MVHFSQLRMQGLRAIPTLATDTSLTMDVIGMSEAHAGALDMTVIVNCVGPASAVTHIRNVTEVNPKVAVASFEVARPSLPSPHKYPTRIEIQGVRFGNDKTKIRVSFTPTISQYEVFYCSDTLLVIDAAGVESLALGSLSATVTHVGVGSSAAPASADICS